VRDRCLLRTVHPLYDRAGPAISRLRTLLRDLADAVRGTEVDYTQGSLGRAILLLAGSRISIKPSGMSIRTA